MSKTIIKAENISRHFGDGVGKLTVLANLNLSIPSNSSVAITGVSGSGKSTLLHILSGLDLPSNGEVFINELPITKASEKQINQWRQFHFGFIYQFHFLIAELSAIENIALPLLIRGEDKKSAHKCALDLLTQVGLENRSYHRPGELSGGERQRVAVARAVVGKPQCIFADEPTGSLDNENAKKIWDVIYELCSANNSTLIVVTHDQNLASQCNYHYRLNQGKIMAQ